MCGLWSGQHLSLFQKNWVDGDSGAFHNKSWFIWSLWLLSEPHSVHFIQMLSVKPDTTLQAAALGSYAETPPLHRALLPDTLTALALLKLLPEPSYRLCWLFRWSSALGSPTICLFSWLFPSSIWLWRRRAERAPCRCLYTWSVPQEIAVTQEMHHEHCKEAPLCKSAQELILLCIASVTGDDQSHTKR